MEPQYLFHYTNIQSLALILHSKTFKFNSLMKVDDELECLSQDIGYAGKYCFVSSWTDDEKESIPMWALYTDLKGIRIKMETNPFIRYKWADPLFPKQEIESYLSLNQIYKNDCLPYLTDNSQILYKINYTDDIDKIIPKTKVEVQNGFHIDYNRIGKHKSSIWKFQREWRYILYLRPVKLSDYLKSINIGKTSYKKNIAENKDLPLTELYLDLRDECIDNMEVLCAPKMNRGDRILLELLMEKYCKHGKIEESSIHIR